MGIALIIAVSQLKDLLGYSRRSSASGSRSWPAGRYGAARSQLNSWALGCWGYCEFRVSVFFAVAFLGSPGSLLVVAAASAAVALIHCRWTRSTLASARFWLHCLLPHIPHLSIARISELLPSGTRSLSGRC